MGIDTCNTLIVNILYCCIVAKVNTMDIKYPGIVFDLKKKHILYVWSILIYNKINFIYYTKSNCRVHLQCSEICGILHSSMPLVIESVDAEKFLSFLYSNLYG